MSKKKLSYTLFTEKYRPSSVADMLLPEKYKQFFLNLVKEGEVPNLLLFSSTPGSGKTSVAKAICDDIDADYLYINISSESGIDTLRTDIARFASGKNVSGKKKIVIMDECLEEHEKIRIGTTDSTTIITLKDMTFGQVYGLPSFNIDTGEYENDMGMIISQQEKLTYTVTVVNADGIEKKISVSDEHPFMINVDGKYVQRSIKDGNLLGCLSVVKDDSQYAAMFDSTKSYWIIKAIDLLGIKTVRNLHVFKNHTFITENGIVTHNCDGASPKLMMGLRAGIEEFHNSCRFILTCNYVNKIIPALRSRLMEYDFNMNTKDIREEMLPKVQRRLKMVLQNESVDFKDDIVDQLAENLYPDIRKMYGTLQQYSKQNGIIDNNIFTFESVEDQFYDLILTKKFTLARQFMLDSGYSFDDMYSDLYHNLIPRIADKGKQAQIILTIAEWQYRSSFSTDPEIPFAAMLVEIMSNL